jgi:WS/DGAT/MGAT family acyltransferase
MGAATLLRLSLLDPDAPTPLRSAPGVMKRAAWSQPLSLAGVRRVARATGTTVNDVLVSAVAGGLGTYLRAGGLPVARIRAMVPVDMRPRDGAAASGGNRFSLVLLDLPVGVVDARERLMRVRIEMDRIKSSLEAQAGWVMVVGLGLLPAWLERPAARFFGDKASLVLTNVIGPRARRYLGGSRIRSQTFWEPESGGLSLGVSIFSYAGAVVLGVVGDDQTVRRPGELAAAFESAYADLDREVAPAR